MLPVSKASIPGVSSDPGAPKPRRMAVKASRTPSEISVAERGRRLCFVMRADRGGVLIHRVCVVALAVCMLVAVSSAHAYGAFTPNHTEYHALTFPVREAVHFTDDFGGARRHPGN